MSDNADVGRPDFHQSRHFVPLLTFSVPFSASKDKSTKVKSKDDGHAARARDSTAHAHDVGAPHLAPKSGRALALTGPLGLAASRRKEKPPEDRVCVLVPAPAATRSRGERFETYNIHAKKKKHITNLSCLERKIGKGEENEKTAPVLPKQWMSVATALRPNR